MDTPKKSNTATILSLGLAGFAGYALYRYTYASRKLSTEGGGISESDKRIIDRDRRKTDRMGFEIGKGQHVRPIDQVGEDIARSQTGRPEWRRDTVGTNAVSTSNMAAL